MDVVRDWIDWLLFGVQLAGMAHHALLSDPVPGLTTVRASDRQAGHDARRDYTVSAWHDGRQNHTVSACRNGSPASSACWDGFPAAASASQAGIAPRRSSVPQMTAPAAKMTAHHQNTVV